MPIPVADGLRVLRPSNLLCSLHRLFPLNSFHTKLRELSLAPKPQPHPPFPFISWAALFLEQSKQTIELLIIGGWKDSLPRHHLAKFYSTNYRSNPICSSFVSIQNIILYPIAWPNFSWISNQPFRAFQQLQKLRWSFTLWNSIKLPAEIGISIQKQFYRGILQ